MNGMNNSPMIYPAPDSMSRCPMRDCPVLNTQAQLLRASRMIEESWEEGGTSSAMPDLPVIRPEDIPRIHDAAEQAHIRFLKEEWSRTRSVKDLLAWSRAVGERAMRLAAALREQCRRTQIIINRMDKVLGR